MNYKVLHEDPSQDILTRLLHVRKVDCPIEHFLNPTFSYYRKDPMLLNDMETAILRIMQAIKQGEKIMIFGDYDVDGITASYMLYTFFRDFLSYKNSSIMYPHRRHDGYGIKNKHIDVMKQKGVTLIITVDNGITSIDEAQYAATQGIDMIITDHHEAGQNIPAAHAVINPHISSDYSFNGLCGATVVFKLINALAKHQNFSKKQRTTIFNHFLPIAAIATVADCVPLVDENRKIVQQGLQLMNQGHMPRSLRNFLQQINIKGSIDTFHIGFLIGPRINAGGRIATPYDSLYTLLYEGDKQRHYIEQIEKINTERKKLQEQALKDAKKQVDPTTNIMIAASAEYHEGVVGIVAGRLTEEYNKPSLIMYINEQNSTATGSLRAPTYFSIIDMLHHPDISQYTLRSGGHQQAGGLTVAIDKLAALQQALHNYCNQKITPDMLIQTITIDTPLYKHEHDPDSLQQMQKLAPFGIGNPEPQFLLKETKIDKVDIIGKKETKHLKLHFSHGENKASSMFWRQEAQAANIKVGMRLDLIGKIQPDTYNGGRYLEGKHYHIKE